MTSRPSHGGTITYQPALDGLRAIAVSMVLCFHAGFDWMSGGYFGVSMFFTLSGFLVTSLLLSEFGAQGSVSFGRFYARRARRLVPASLACVGAILLARALGEFALVPHLGQQLSGAVAQVYNWVQLAGGSSYAALFGRSPALTSPVEHYWSLAIEEQYYLLWPLGLGLLMHRSRRTGTSVLRPLVILTVAFGMSGPMIGAIWGADAAYWATPARLGEVLIGATAAAWLAGGGQVPLWGRRIAPIALAAAGLLAVALPAASGPAYSGWMTPLAAVSAVLLLSMQVPGRVRDLLSLGPLVWLGRVSYGVYLYHWPVFLLLRQHGWQLDNPAGFALALAITGAVAVASFVLLEQPIRRHASAPRRVFIGASLAMAVTLLLIMLLPTTRGLLEPNQKVLDAATIDTGPPPPPLVADTQPNASSTSTPQTVTSLPNTMQATISSTTTELPLLIDLPPSPSRPVRILVVGDSTALYVGQGLAEWATEHPNDAQVDVLWSQGCGFILDGTITSFEATKYVDQSRDVVEQQMTQRIESLHPDVVVLMTTVNDVANRQWTLAEGPLSPRDARFRNRMLHSYRTLTDSVLALGVHQVVWVLPPVPDSYWSTPEMGELDRYEIQHEVIREVVESIETGVGVTDLDGWMKRAGHAVDEAWRPDGTHLTETSAKTLANDYFGPSLMRVALGLPLS